MACPGNIKEVSAYKAEFLEKVMRAEAQITSGKYRVITPAEVQQQGWQRVIVEVADRQ